MRVTLTATLGNIKIPLQVDIGAGDAVVPPQRSSTIQGFLICRARGSAPADRKRQWRKM
jgi:hypothetical protein